MKIWVKDSLGRPGYQPTRWEVVGGRRKKIKEETFRIPSKSGDVRSVDLYSFLKLVEQAEKRHIELRNIQVCWHVDEGSRGRFGAYHPDYDPGYTEYWIVFERLETDDEEVKREGPAAKKEQDEKVKVGETKALLKKQTKKYVKE